MVGCLQSTDNMFEPLKQRVDLLTSYNVEINENIHKQIEDLPERWESTKKKVAYMNFLVLHWLFHTDSRSRGALLLLIHSEMSGSRGGVGGSWTMIVLQRLNFTNISGCDRQTRCFAIPKFWSCRNSKTLHAVRRQAAWISGRVQKVSFAM